MRCRKERRTALALTRLANDASASSAMRSGKSQGEAPPHLIHFFVTFDVGTHFFEEMGSNF